MLQVMLNGQGPPSVGGVNDVDDVGVAGGLSMRWIRHRGSKRHLGHRYATSVLALWVQGHNDVDARRSGRWHRRYQGSARRFDYWAAGEYAAIQCGPSENVSLHLALPPEVLERHCPEGLVQAGRQACRFQFIETVLERQVLRLAEHTAAGEPLGSLYTDALSAAIVVRLATRLDLGRAVSDVTPLPEAARRRLVDLIESKLNGPLGLEDLALTVGLRSAAFLKAFRASFGISPHQYLLARRIERAKEMLRQDIRLTDLALSLGFVSHAHFSDTFRARTGMTPSDWRRDRCRHVA